MALRMEAGSSYAFAARYWMEQASRAGSMAGYSLRVRGAALPLAATAFLLVLALPTFIIPFSTDEAYFALGARTILSGEVLYQDLWDLKPPAIYLTYAVPFALLGEHPEAIRFLDSLMVLLSMGGLFLLGRRFFSANAGIFAAGFYAFSYFGLAGLTGLGEAESFMVPALIFAFAIYASTRDGFGPRGTPALAVAFAAGLLIGVATAYKFSGALFLLGLPLIELLRQEGWTWRGTLSRLALATTGLLLVQAAWVGYLAAVGGLGAYFDILVNYTIPYNNFESASTDPRTIVEATGGWVTGAAFLTVPAWAAVVFASRRRQWRSIVLFGALAVLAWLSVVSQGKFFGYHWTVVLPFLAVLAGFAVSSLIEALRSENTRERLVAPGVLVVGFILLASSPLLKTYDGYVALFSRLDERVSEAQMDAELSPHLAMNHELVAYIREHGGQEDSFFVWGFWTLPYFWEDRELPTRFVTSAAVRASWSPQEWRQEMVADLKQSRPRFIAVATGDEQSWLTGTSQTSAQHMCQSYPELRGLIMEGYQPVLNNGLFVLYDAAAPASAVPGVC